MVAVLLGVFTAPGAFRAKVAVLEGVGPGGAWLTEGVKLGELDGAGAGVARREVLGLVRRADDSLMRVAEPRTIGEAGEPDAAAVGIATGDAALTRRSAPDGLGLGEAVLIKAVGLGKFDAVARGAEVGGNDPMTGTDGGRVALKRPTPSKPATTTTPSPSTTINCRGL